MNMMQPLPLGEMPLKISVDVEEPPTVSVGKDTNVELDQPFSIFTTGEKKFIVFMASLAALFSPLSASIYFPAMDALSKDLNVSLSRINLTITSYLIFQGIAPTFVGKISDETGRRPSYLICFVIFIGANIGLALQDSYAALFVLRCLQSSGSSGTVTLANAVVADLVTSAERGTYLGYASIGTLVGPTFGPVVGGVLCQYLGWRSVFWFLTICAGVVMTVFIIIYPETCRKVVGNGAIYPQRWNLPVAASPIPNKGRKPSDIVSKEHNPSRKRRWDPFESVRIIFDRESGMVLFYSSILLAGFHMVLAGLPSQLEAKYGFNTLQVGLCYLPTGLGSLAAARIVGKCIDWNFRRHARKEHLEIDKQKQQDLQNFPIEAARLEVVLPLAALAATSMIAYGWVMEYRTSLAGPIILLFVLSFGLIGAFQASSTLIVDLNRQSPGTATAAMNLARCWMSAGAVAVVVPLLEKIGAGWTAVVVSGVWIICSPMLFLVMKYGPHWREKKRMKDKARNKNKEPRQQLA